MIKKKLIPFLVLLLSVVAIFMACEPVSSLPTYAITFDKNATTATGTMAAQTITTGLSANLTTNAFANAGKTFLGWATSANGVVAYANGAEFTMGAEDVTLYAVWTVSRVAAFTVTFNKNAAAATGTMVAQEIEVGQSEALTTNAFVNTGFEFSGWATTATGTVAYANEASYTMGNASVTLYAVWTAVVPAPVTYGLVITGCPDFGVNGTTSITVVGNHFEPAWANTAAGLTRTEFDLPGNTLAFEFTLSTVATELEFKMVKTNTWNCPWFASGESGTLFLNYNASNKVFVIPYSTLPTP